MSSTRFNDPAHQARIYEISNRLAVMLGHEPYEAPTFTLRSRSRPDIEYRMVVTPDGIAVHVGEGCEGEQFNGPTGCWHSKTRSKDMTQAVTPYQAPSSPVEIRFNEEQMKVITSTIAKGATPDELQLFVATCTRTGLDPFLKQIYAVKRYDSKEKREVMAIQVGIDGLRLIAERTGKYGGQDPIEWLDADGVWSEVWTGNGDHPIAARTAVYRKDWSHKAPAVCRWDSYAQTYGQEGRLMPNWAKMPDVMLGKCAEALALRRAFPAEMSGFAAAVGEEYDPDADLELQQMADNWKPAPDAIEGEVIEHEATQQQAPVSASDRTGGDNGASSAATPAAAPSPATDDQLASIKEWSEQLTREQQRQADAVRRERWPYAIDDGNRFLSARLSESDADEYLAVLIETHGQQASLV